MLDYLTEIADWLMVVITALYLSATIIICVFNGKSAKAAKEQTEEIKRQFYSLNRPVITTRVILLENGIWMLRVKNEGSQAAFNTKITINQELIDSLPEEKFRKFLIEDCEKIRTVGVGQRFCLFLGTEEYAKKGLDVPVAGHITYSGVNGLDYSEDFLEDIRSYAVLCCGTDDDTTESGT